MNSAKDQTHLGKQPIPSSLLICSWVPETAGLSVDRPWGEGSVTLLANIANAPILPRSSVSGRHGWVWQAASRLTLRLSAGCLGLATSTFRSPYDLRAIDRCGGAAITAAETLQDLVPSWSEELRQSKHQPGAFGKTSRTSWRCETRGWTQLTSPRRDSPLERLRTAGTAQT